MPKKSAGGPASATLDSFAPMAEKPAGGEASAADENDKANDRMQFAKLTVVAHSGITGIIKYGTRVLQLQ